MLIDIDLVAPGFSVLQVQGPCPFRIEVTNSFVQPHPPKVPVGREVMNSSNAAVSPGTQRAPTSAPTNKAIIAYDAIVENTRFINFSLTMDISTMDVSWQKHFPLLTNIQSMYLFTTLLPLNARLSH